MCFWTTQKSAFDNADEDVKYWVRPPPADKAANNLPTRWEFALDNALTQCSITAYNWLLKTLQQYPEPFAYVLEILRAQPRPTESETSDSTTHERPPLVAIAQQDDNGDSDDQHDINVIQPTTGIEPDLEHLHLPTTVETQVPHQADPAAIPNEPPHIPATMSIASVKIPTPKDFTPTTESVEGFLRRVNAYFRGRTPAVDDGTKIAFTLGLLKEGQAYIWADSFNQEQDRVGATTNGTWADFEAGLKRGFSTFEPKASAVLELSTIIQGNRTADDYVLEFAALVTKSGLTEFESLKNYFLKGMHPALRKSCYLAGSIPTTMDLWYERAKTMYAQWREERIYQRVGNQGSNQNNQKGKQKGPGPRYSTPSKDPNTMDIDTVKTTINRLSKPEHLEHIKKGLCFGCHKPGHLTRDCPNRASTSLMKKPFKPYNNYGKNNDTRTRSMTINTDAVIRKVLEQLKIDKDVDATVVGDDHVNPDEIADQIHRICRTLDQDSKDAVAQQLSEEGF